MVFVGRIYEELMKDFSQDQMKANPPNTWWTQEERSHWQKRKKIGPFSWTSWTAKTKEHCPGSDVSSWLKNSSSPTQPIKLTICRFFSVCFQMPSTLQAPLVPSKKASQPEASHCYWAVVFFPPIPALSLECCPVIWLSLKEHLPPFPSPPNRSWTWSKIVC